MATTSTSSGLQYEDKVVGDGAEATAGAHVTVHYPAGCKTTTAAQAPNSIRARIAAIRSNSHSALVM